jgi:heme-degrading monooxygenase HmoA
VTLHVYGVPRHRIPSALLRMALDRRSLRRTPGLRFWKLLGTGHGRTFSVRDADPRHWALFAVWDSRDAQAAFEASSPVARRWGRIASERWDVELHPLRSKGRWSGRDPFEGSDRGTPGPGPVAALTRARLRWGRIRRFWRAVPPVALDVQTSPGLRFALGIGEAPVGLQATFSVWDDDAALDAFAYRGAAHVEVMRRTREEQWYAEELFARFTVVSASGTVGGVDPLAA